MGGGARGVKIAIGGNGASVCLRSVTFFEVFAESDISARKKKKKSAGNSSAGPPSVEVLWVLKLGRTNHTTEGALIQRLQCKV